MSGRGSSRSRLELKLFGCASVYDSQLISSSAPKRAFEHGDERCCGPTAGHFQDADRMDGASKKAKQSNTVDRYLGRGRHSQYDYEKGYPFGGQGNPNEDRPDGHGIDPDLGDSNYQHVPEPTPSHFSSASFSLETIFGHDFATSPDLWEDQLSLFSDECRAFDFFLDPTPDSRSSSKCVSPFQLSTGEIMNTQGSPPSTDITSEYSLYFLNSPTVDEPMQLNHQHVDQLLPSESSSSLDITDSCVINRDYDDGYTNNCREQTPATGMEVPAIPHTYRPRGRVLGKGLCEGRQLTGSQCSPSKRRLACPWYKKDPLKYQDCARFKLQRVKDVKQHIYRKHMQSSEGSGTKPKPDEISEDQRRELNENANRGKTDAEQWLNIWDTIFPGEPHPRSPYLGNGQEEVLALLRNLWEKRRAEITASVLVSSQPSILSPAVIQRMMDSIFDRFEVEFSS